MGFFNRIGAAIDSDLLTRFDDFIAKQGNAKRSEAFHDLIRDRLVSTTVPDPLATVPLTYDRHSRLLFDKPISLQHDHHHLIVCSSLADLDFDSCLEAVILRSDSKQVQKLADMLIGTKGVQHGRLAMSGLSSALSKAA